MTHLDRRKFLSHAAGTALLSSAKLSGRLQAMNAEAASVSEEQEFTKIFWKSGADPGQAAVLAGHGLGRAEISIARLPDHNPSDNSMPSLSADHAQEKSVLRWEPAQTLEQTNSYAYIQIPKSWQLGQYVLRLRNSNQEELILHLNQPEVWWCLGENGPTAAPGTDLRIFGQFFQLNDEPPQVRLLDAARHSTPLAATQMNPYAVSIRLPSTLPFGPASIQVHNGFGGESGWSEPFTFSIEHIPAWPSTIFRVTDFGAAGDSLHDDTDAFRAALEAGGKNHGGIVFVPRGTYRITAQLTMPARTVLRGESRETVWLMVPKTATGFNTVIAGMGEFVIEDLSIVAQTPSRIITAPDVPSMYTGYPPYGEPGNAAAPDVHLRRLRIHHLRYAHRLGPPDKDPRRLEDAGPSTIALAGPRISIQDCVVVSPGMPIILHRMSHARITGNEFRMGRNGWYGFWGATESLVESNLFEGQDLEASYGSFANYGNGSGPDISRLYIADNLYRNSFGGEREAITFDSSGNYPWKGALGKGTTGKGTAQTSATAATLSENVPDAKNAWTGLGCLITGGRGLGQLRRIVANEGTVVSIDAPWDVTPDETSTVAITPYKRDVVVYRNQSQDTQVGVQLWGGGYNFIIAGNITTRSGGFWGSAAEYTDAQTIPATQYFLPLYFTQWLQNEVQEGFVYEQGPDTTNGAVCGLYVRDIPERPDAGVLTFANIIRNNRLHGNAKIVLRYYDESPYLKRLRAARELRGKPWSMATLIEGNIVSDSRIGVEIDQGFDGVLLRDNRFLRVRQEIHRMEDRT
jgi:hypothetical protein